MKNTRAQRLRRGGWRSALLMPLLLPLLLGACAQQQIRDEATGLLRAGQYEAALRVLQNGVERYPDSTLLRSGLATTREESVSRLVSQANQDRMQGRLESAAVALQRAAQLDAGNRRLRDLQADLKHERQLQLALQTAHSEVEAGRKEGALRTLEAALAQAPRHPDLGSLKRQLETELRLEAGPSARPTLAETRPIGLDFRNATLSMLLEAIRDGSGVNFVVDRDVQVDQRASIFIRSARVEDAIDLVLSAFQLARHIVDAKTVMVYPNTPDKHRLHREQVIRVFHLANAQARTTASLLQSMLRIQPPFVDERANLIALRESPDIVLLAERLVALHDQGDAEVMLDVEVMEVKSTRLTELGINFPSSVTFSPLPLSGQSGLTVESLRGLNSSRVGVGVGNVLLNLRREVGDFNTLANPRIRSRSREKATILIGDKIPVITTTAGSNGFVSENVSYQDVGLKLEVEPIVSPDDEVAIKLGLEVSSLAAQVRTTGGSLAYQIGTRTASTNLRLRDGETQLLGGLISRDDRSSANRIPGLGDLPLAGRLFSSEKDDLQRTELVLAITPRILRGAARPDAALAEMWVGTESFTRLRPRPVLPTAGPVDVGSTPAGLASPATVGVDAPGTTAGSKPQAKSALPLGLKLLFSGPKAVKVGEEFTVVLRAASGLPLAGLPMDLRFSRETLEVTGVLEGGYFGTAGASSSFTHAVNAAEGRISVGLLGQAENGVAADGEVLLIRLKALASGPAELWFQGVDAIGVGRAVPLVAEKPRWSLQIP